jgi:hypothetical protein
LARSQQLISSTRSASAATSGSVSRSAGASLVARFSASSRSAIRAATSTPNGRDASTSAGTRITVSVASFMCSNLDQATDNTTALRTAHKDADFVATLDDSRRQQATE